MSDDGVLEITILDVSYRNTTKMILATKEVITATLKVISGTTMVVLPNEEVITGTLKVILVTTKVLLATEEVTTANLQNI